MDPEEIDYACLCKYVERDDRMDRSMCPWHGALGEIEDAAMQIVDDPITYGKRRVA